MKTIIKQEMTFAEIKATAKNVVKCLGAEKAFDFSERVSILRLKTSKHKDYKRSFNLAELSIQIRSIIIQDLIKQTQSKMDSYYLKCDYETAYALLQELNRLRMEIGIAPLTLPNLESKFSK